MAGTSIGSSGLFEKKKKKIIIINTHPADTQTSPALVSASILLFPWELEA